MPGNHVLVCQGFYEHNCKTCIVEGKCIIIFFSYMALLTLNYGGRMEKTQEAHRVAEHEGLSYREAKRVVESNLFLDEYPRWNLGSPHQSVILHEMFLHAESWGCKEAECMCCRGHQSCVREPNSEEDQSALRLIGYHTSCKELRDVYYSIYSLNRVLGFPSCGEVKRMRVIQEILSSLQERLQRRTPSTEAKDVPEHDMGLIPLPTYEVALQDVHCKVIQTAANLQNDLDRLDSELWGRSWTRSPSITQNRMRSESRHRTRSQSQHRRWSRGWSKMWFESHHRTQMGSPHWEHPRGRSGEWVRTRSQDCHQGFSPNKWICSQDCAQGSQGQRVSFRMPEDEDSGTASQEPSIELPTKDLEQWLDHQVDQLGTTTWWGELQAVPSITDLHQFARKIQASFHVPEIQFWVCPDHGYSAPPAPKCLNRGAFLPEWLEYQDVHQRPKLLTEAYCQCLQHWAEKVSLPVSQEFWLLAESVRELCQAIGEFVTITKQDIMEGLEMEKPIDSHQPPPMTIFGQVLDSPTKGQEKTPTAMGIPQQNRMPMLRGRPSLFASSQLSNHSPGTPSLPVVPLTRVLAVRQSATLTRSFIDTTVEMETLEPAQLARKTSNDVATMGKMTLRVSSLNAGQIIQDDSTGAVYLDIIATSMGRIVIGSTKHKKKTSHRMDLHHHEHPWYLPLGEYKHLYICLLSRLAFLSTKIVKRSGVYSPVQGVCSRQ